MIALDTNEKHRYIFSTDRNKSASEQPALCFHYPTCREVRQIANLFDDADKQPTVDAQMVMRLDAIRVILCGWENVKDRKGKPVPYDPQNLESILTDTDITELQSNLLREMAATE